MLGRITARGTQFLNYWLDALDAHSLHAPFIYQLYTEVVQGSDNAGLSSINSFREKVYRDRSTIKVTDMGTGGHSRAIHDRVVGKLAKSSHHPKVAKLLYHLVRFQRARTILELGTNVGLTTVHLALAAPQGKVVTLEGCPQLSKRAQEHFKDLGLSNIDLVTGPIEENLPALLQKMEQPDLIFIDANHCYRATLEYFQGCLKEIRQNTVMVLDDIHWSKAMYQAWTEIRIYPQVRISVDLYQAGLLFFDPKFEKNHYVLEF